MELINYKSKFQWIVILKELHPEILCLLIFSFVFGISQANNIFIVNGNRPPIMNQYYFPFLTITIIIPYVKKSYIDIWTYFMSLCYTIITFYIFKNKDV
jgi:hypothetical protein